MSKAAAVPGLASTAARGFAWMTALTLAAKVFGFVSQIILTWVLAPEDFGLISLAFTVSTFADLVQSFGLREVLVKRQVRMRIWGGPAIWLSLITGLSVMAVMSIAAPIAAIVYGKGWIVAHLIWILALSAPINALGIVPDACLQQQLRFRAVALLGFFQTSGYLFFTVTLALLGFEAYSFALGIVLTASVRLFVVYGLARPTFSLRPRLRRSLHLVRDSLTLIASATINNTMAQGDKFMLGFFHSERDVGFYFFAYNLSLQTVILLALNIGRVLFPVFSKLKDQPDRLRDAFVRAQRTLLTIGGPLCMLQAVGSGPFVRALLSEEKWGEAIRPLQILSVMMFFHIGWSSSRSLVQVAGTYGLFLRSTITYAVSYLTIVFVAAKYGDLIWVSLAAGAALASVSIADTALALRLVGSKSARVVARVYTPGLLVGLGAAVPCLALETYLPAMGMVRGTPVRDVVLLAVLPMVCLAASVPLARWLCPDVYEELASRAAPLLRRLPGPLRRILGRGGASA